MYPAGRTGGITAADRGAGVPVHDLSPYPTTDIPTTPKSALADTAIISQLVTGFPVHVLIRHPTTDIETAPKRPAPGTAHDPRCKAGFRVHALTKPPTTDIQAAPKRPAPDTTERPARRSRTPRMSPEETPDIADDPQDDAGHREGPREKAGHRNQRKDPRGPRRPGVPPPDLPAAQLPRELLEPGGLCLVGRTIGVRGHAERRQPARRRRRG